MYELGLTLHNLTRWLVLIAAILVIYRSVMGLQSRTYTGADRAVGSAFTGLMDLQILFGILLFIVSPFIQAASSDMSAAMQASQTRFFLAEHWVMMVVAVVLAHVGNVRVRKATENIAKHRQALIWYGLSLALVLLAIPWWRPLLRFG